MTQIAALKTMHPAHPIGVYFETENIYTLNPSSQYSLDIQALLADWESGNKSRRMILSYDQRIMTGQYPVADLAQLVVHHNALPSFQITPATFVFHDVSHHHAIPLLPAAQGAALLLCQDHCNLFVIIALDDLLMSM